MQFVNPLFLIALVGIAIPVVIHLFNFRRYKKVYFSNVQYLQELQSETRRHSRLREWLILACRILAIAFLVLAFAQPIIPHPNQAPVTGQTSVSIYLDNSFSMDNTNAEGPLLETAKRKTRELVAAYKPTDRFQLLTNDMEGSQFRWVSRDELLSLLDEVQTTPATLPLASVLKRQYDFAHSTASTNIQTYVISDFQRSTLDWSQLPNDTTASTTLIPLEASAVNNLYLDSMALNAPVLLPGSTATIQLFVVNAGSESLEQVPLHLYLNGRERALTTVDIGAGQRESCTLNFTIDSPGLMQGYVTTTDYPITFDDRLYFTIEVAQTKHVLCINGQSDNRYLTRLFAHDSLIDYHSVTEHNIDFDQLSNNDLVILNELSSIPSALASLLQPYVETGGSLLVIPAANITADTYNAALQLFHAPLLGAFIPQQQQAAQINTTAAHFRNVFGSTATTDMEMPTLKGHYTTRRTTQTVLEPLITLSGGDDYLTQTTYGAGKVFLLTAPLQTEYTDFVQQALFVPTLFNMALYSHPLPPLFAWLGDDDPIAINVTTTTDGEPLRLRASDTTFELIPDLRTVAGQTLLLPHGEITLADNYQLYNGDQPVAGLSFNYSRLESHMEFCSVADLRQALRDYHLDHYTLITNPNKPLDEQIRSLHRGSSLWHWCVILCLLFLLAESLLLRYQPKDTPQHEDHD